MTRLVLLTGATGFVGRQIYRHLLDKGASVRLIMRPGWEAKLSVERDRVDVIETDDLFSHPFEAWHSVLNGVDTVIHSAWFVDPGVYLNSPKNIDCLTGTLTLAKAAQAQGVKRFVGIGTCIEYKVTSVDISTDSAFEPTTLYSAAKLSLFHTLSHMFKDDPCSFLWCRLFYLYGEGEDPRRFTAFLHQKLQKGEIADLTSGTQIRDFMDVSDAGKRIVDLTYSDKENGANICTGKGRSIRDIAESIADIYGRRDLLNFGVRPDNLVDPNRIVGVPTLP